MASRGARTYPREVAGRLGTGREVCPDDTEGMLRRWNTRLRRRSGGLATRLTILLTVLITVAACVAPPGAVCSLPRRWRVGAHPAAPATAAGPLRLVDGDLTDASGRTVLLHGINVVRKSAPYVPLLGIDLTEADFDRYRAAGFNAVRLGIWYRELLPTPTTIDEAYLDRVAEVVDAFAEHDMWVLLDFHQDYFEGMPPWATTAEAAALSAEPPRVRAWHRVGSRLCEPAFDPTVG